MLLVEHLGVALERHGCHEHASAAAGRLLGVPCEPCCVGAEEEAGSTRGRGFPERQAVPLALGDRQAVVVRPDVAREHESTKSVRRSRCVSTFSVDLIIVGETGEPALEHLAQRAVEGALFSYGGSSPCEGHG